MALDEGDCRFACHGIGRNSVRSHCHISNAPLVIAAGFSRFACILAIACADSHGLILAIWTVSLFWLYGEGTAAPWDPPQRFIVRGPYRYVRNPMISGVLALLAAETLMLWSLPILCWLMLALVVNVVYIPFVEERGLAKRFGEPYLTYKENVPRWLPRLRPWMEE